MNLQSGGLLPPNKLVEDNLIQFQTLTKREKQILSMVGEGNTSRTISDKLCVSIYTVNVHRKHIIKKLAIKNQSELYRMAGLLKVL